ENEAKRRLIGAALDSLTAALRAITISVDGGNSTGVTADFLGIKGIAGIATTFALEVSPPGLLAGNDDAPIFRAHAEAKFDTGLDAPLFVKGGLAAVVVIDVELWRDGIWALPRIDLPARPHFGLRFPRIAVTDWSLANLDINLHRPELLQFPTRSFANITTTWDPKFSLSIDGGGRLNLATTNNSDLSLTVNG